MTQEEIDQVISDANFILQLAKYSPNDEGRVRAASIAGMMYGSTFWEPQGKPVIKPEKKQDIHVGSLVRIVKDPADNGKNVGKVVRVTAVHNTQFPFVTTLTEPFPCNSFASDEIELVSSNAQSFKVGDRVKVIDGMWVGLRGTITKFEGPFPIHTDIEDNNGDKINFKYDEVELA